MPSLVPGYTYDVFISYRHKDNHTLGERDATGWVTDFVGYLKREIQSTIKEDVNVYFDENTYDGILETHVVHDSLKEKLKCVLFMPILSQTYCDPKSFAWRHEFLAFKELAVQDSFGLKIPLKNGNVASRILPVRIHELDSRDQTLLEHEIGPIRSIDFVFKSPGVNRPITPADKRDDSASRVLYKDQINKVAQAVKDVLVAMTEPLGDEPTIGIRKRADDIKESKTRRKQLMAMAATGLLVMLALVAYWFRKDDSPLIIDKSIAILPFVDMSPGHDLEYLGDGISEEIINALTAIKDLRIVGRTSSFQFKGDKLDLREVGERLNVATVLEGSVQQSGGRLRITAQLINTKTNTHIWSERYEVEQTDIFKIQDNIAGHIVEMLSLTLSSQVQDRLVKKETTPEAYEFFLKGLFQYKQENFRGTIDFIGKVLALDSQYAPAYAYMALSEAWIVIREKERFDAVKTREAIRLSERSIELDPFLPEGYSSRALIAWAIERDYRKARTYFEKSVDLNPSSSLIKNRYAYFLTWMGEFTKASRLAQEAMQSDPVDYNCYANLYNCALYDGNLSQAWVYHREWKRIFGSKHLTTRREMELCFHGNSFARVITLSDSLLNSGETLNQSDLAFTAMARFALHQTKGSDQLLEQLLELKKQNAPGIFYNLARVYAYRHEYDASFSNLQQSFQHHENVFDLFKIEPLFKDLHNDPAYIKLYTAAGFDKY